MYRRILLFGEVPFTLFIFKSKDNASGNLLFLAIVSCGEKYLAKRVLLLLPISLSTRKNTIQVFMGVSLISIFVAVDVKMFFLRYQHNFLAKTF